MPQEPTTQASKTTALVLGLGVSGLAAARLLAAEGAEVTVVDATDGETLRRRRAELEAEGIRVLLVCEALPRPFPSLAVVSPGIAMHSPWVRELKSAGVPLLGELELGAARCACPVAAITGTNGKSTAVTLCRDALAAGGMRARAGGNIGIPACEWVASSRELDWLVLEVSTFQMECVTRFRPRVGVLLNLRPDHLDRHADIETYYALKWRCFADMGAGDTVILPEALVAQARERLPSTVTVVPFGTTPQARFRWRPGAVESPLGSIRTAGTRFDNGIMGPLAAAVFAAASVCGVGVDALQTALRAFQPLPHRMESVGTWKRVRYIDDSKATNLAALRAGLEMAGSNVRLVAGGILKEKSTKEVKETLANRTRCVYLIGQAAETLRRAWCDGTPCRVVGTMEAAVEAAVADARAGETVLLSPGCSSFDQYRSYAARGDHFKSLVYERMGETT